jgi:hypothetical protein
MRYEISDWIVPIDSEATYFFKQDRLEISLFLEPWHDFPRRTLQSRKRRESIPFHLVYSANEDEYIAAE